MTVNSRLMVQKPHRLVVILVLVIIATYAWRQPLYRDSEAKPTYASLTEYPQMVPHRQEVEQLTTRVAMEDLSAIIPPYQHLRNVFLVAPNYSLATCQIEKNMATIRASIFCYLTNMNDVLERNLTISTMFWDNTVCDYTYVRRNMSDTISSLGENMTIFTVIRHPIDRFLSGYVDKCYNELTYFNVEQRCFGCKHDMGCFLEKLRALFIDNVRMRVAWTPMNQHYLRHFAPQTWYCGFKTHKSKYIFVHYRNGPNGTKGIADDFDKILERAHVPGDIRSTVHSEMTKGGTRHSTANTEQRKAAEHQLLSDDYLMRLFMHLYYHDFVEFGFN